MPHLRARFAESHLRQALKLSPIVGLIGAQAHYNHMSVFDVKHYGTKGGAIVPFVFSIKKDLFGFIIAPAGVTSSILKSANAFLRQVPDSQVFILDGSGSHWERLSSRMLKAPLLAVI